MLDDRDVQLDAEENAYGQQAIWRHVYDLMKCDYSACHLGPYCWLDPVATKHYRLRTQTLKRLVTYAEKGGVLETHKDVPNEIRGDLYTEEQQRQEKDKGKNGNILGGTPYPPININVLPSYSAELDVTASSAIADPSVSKERCLLRIPGFRDVAAKEYSEWLASTVSDDTLKAAFRQACNVTLSDGFDLEHIYKDQNPRFFVGKGVKPGTARTFVGNIRDWVETAKKLIPTLEDVYINCVGVGRCVCCPFDGIE
ncbi:hypothetical protein N7462_008623 [Penicillium macrosclerotiorum]|uniref:uncharacterized protein n=1 Tax=Penicillium macrosclerotiorum TaxID=303699 RepID=UPI0025465F09|nr:uncharacterized protein N7462_008623 [Penicillium macrosclerotiorum]KAJ5675726.1 hypothetical protein N7462_008623 [Penicillium macrosclerotiorum]